MEMKPGQVQELDELVRAAAERFRTSPPRDSADWVHQAEVMLANTKALHEAGRISEDFRFQSVSMAINTIFDERLSSGEYEDVLAQPRLRATRHDHDPTLWLLLAETFREYGEDQIARLIEFSPAAFRQRYERAWWAVEAERAPIA